MKIRVSIAPQERPLEIELSAPEPTLHDLRRAIQAVQRDDLAPAENRLRIIAAGRVLRGSNIPLSNFGNFDNTVIHCAVSELHETRSVARSPSWKARNVRSDASVDSLSEQTVHSLNAGMHFAQSRVMHLCNSFLLMLHISSIHLGQQSGEARQTNATPSDGFGTTETGYSPEALPDGDIESLSTGWHQDDEDGTLSDWVSGYALGFLLGLIMLVVSTDATLEPPKRWVRGIQFGVASNFVFGVVLIVSNYRI